MSYMYAVVLLVALAVDVHPMDKEIRPMKDGGFKVVSDKKETNMVGLTDANMEKQEATAPTVVSLAEKLEAQGMRADADKKEEHPMGPPRMSYIDVGAKWGNSLHLEQDICSYTDCYKLCGSSSCKGKVWDVIAIEATPLLQAYLDALTKHLNGKGPAPRLFLPAGTSKESLANYAYRFGCPTETESAVLTCIEQQFQTELGWLSGEKRAAGLNPAEQKLESEKVERRLAIASSAANLAENPTTKYTFVPAVAGLTDGDVAVTGTSALDAVAGGVRAGSGELKVPQFNFIKWLTETFRFNDYVFVKMDTDMDIQLLNELIDHHYSAASLIDTLVINCNGEKSECQDLFAKIRSQTRINLVTDYPGHDSQSSPYSYTPIDPRPLPERVVWTVHCLVVGVYASVKVLLVTLLALVLSSMQGFKQLALSAVANPKFALCVFSSVVVSGMATAAALQLLVSRKELDLLGNLRARVQLFTRGTTYWRNERYHDQGS